MASVALTCLFYAALLTFGNVKAANADAPSDVLVYFNKSISMLDHFWDSTGFW